MKRKCVFACVLFLSLLSCLLLFGCRISDDNIIGNAGAAADKNDTGTASAVSDTNAAPADDNSARVQEELLPDWSNWTSDSLWHSYGEAVNLLADENHRLITKDSVKVADGKVTVYMYYRGEINDGEYAGSFDSNVLVLVNGKVCDFELNGAQSSNGRITVEREYGTEYFEKVTVSDCDLQKGENTITVLTADYFRQIGHSSAGYLTKPFYSDIERKQSSTLTKNASGLPGVEFTYGTAVPIRSSDFVFDKISFDQSKRCMTIPENGVSGFEQMNSTRGGTVPLERRVLCFVMKNGELLPAWEGSELLNIDFTSDITSAFLPVSCTVEKGEYALFSYFLFDIDGDDFYTPPDRLFFGSPD